MCRCLSRISSIQIAILGALVMLGAPVGCSQGLETDLLPVRGVVTYREQSVAGAEVALIPRDRSSGTRPARGVSDRDGRFTVKTYFTPGVDDPGARAGDYTVTVTKVDVPNGMTIEQWSEANFRKPGSVPPLLQLVPQKYGSVRTSELFVTVADSSVNDFKLELTD